MQLADYIFQNIHRRKGYQYCAVQLSALVASRLHFLLVCFSVPWTFLITKRELRMKPRLSVTINSQAVLNVNKTSLLKINRTVLWSVKKKVKFPRNEFIWKSKRKSYLRDQGVFENIILKVAFEWRGFIVRRSLEMEFILYFQSYATAVWQNLGLKLFMRFEVLSEADVTLAVRLL